MISVAIADDQALVRRGFRLILEIEPDLEVVGEAADGDEAVAMCRELRPDIVLMDVRMPGTDGVSATDRIVQQDQSPTRIIMLTTFDMDDYVYGALQAGASGFLLKDVEPEVLVAGIRSVHSGEALLAPQITRRMIEHYLSRRRLPRGQVDRRLTRLTPRERDILLLMATGRTNPEIAAELVLSETTVKTHVGRVLAKLDARDRVQVVIFAYEAGLISAPRPR